MKLTSPTKPWTHIVRIDDIDPASSNMLIAVMDKDADTFGKPKTVSYARLTIISELKGQIVPVEMEADDYLSQIHPGYTSVDAVSLSLMKMAGHPIATLYKSWMVTGLISPKQLFTCDDQSTTIEYAARRYHWNGTNRGIRFMTNAVSFAGETPQSTLLACKMKTLREVVDHPAIPKNAMVTGGWSGSDQTTITYDVEDVYMEDIFGEVARHALMKPGTKFEFGMKKGRAK